MEKVRASCTWSEDADRLALWAEPSAGHAFVAEPFDDDPLNSLLLELDEDERETGRVAGVEMLGFSEFSRWDTVPKLPILWSLPGRPALPLGVLLRQLQQEIREDLADERKAA